MRLAISLPSASKARQRMPLAWKGRLSRRLKTRSRVSSKAQQLLAQQAQAAGADGVEQRRNGLDVDRVGLVPGQTQQHRLVAAVALAGGAQRAVEDDLHARGGRQQALGAQPQPEQARGAHRPYRVAAARADADLEKVKHRHGHGRLPLRRSRRPGCRNTSGCGRRRRCPRAPPAPSTSAGAARAAGRPPTRAHRHGSRRRRRRPARCAGR
jgi:hypothetical protein